MTEKRDHWAEYPHERSLIAEAIAALPPGSVVVQGEDFHVEYVGMPSDTRDALREFNRRVDEGDTSDAVVTDSRRPDDPREDAP